MGKGRTLSSLKTSFRTLTIFPNGRPTSIRCRAIRARALFVSFHRGTTWRRNKRTWSTSTAQYFFLLAAAHPSPQYRTRPDL
jgi:hypothetical protein